MQGKAKGVGYDWLDVRCNRHRWEALQAEGAVSAASVEQKYLSWVCNFSVDEAKVCTQALVYEAVPSVGRVRRIRLESTPVMISFRVYHLSNTPKTKSNVREIS